MSILYDFNDALRTRKVLVPWPTAIALKAGAPLDEDGAVSNDDDAIGILLNNGDVGKTVVKDGTGYIECELMTGGYLDRDAAEASCGLTYDDDLIAELSGISFVSGGVLPVPEELPEVGADDNGKVLTVSGGAWAAAVPSAGGILSIPLTVEGSTLTLGKKWSEINTAITNGILPFASATGWVLQILSIGETSGTYWVNAFTDARTNTGNVVTMSCAAADGYPTLTFE